MKKITIFSFCRFVRLAAFYVCGSGESAKPRILISTDIGGTDPDDNQSMAHFLMYSNLFETEGLVSSPSYGSGSVSEILRMIDLYEQDLPELQKHADGFPSPDYLRSISKQGRSGAAPYCEYKTATEGSDWIVRCARKESDRPLWVLVWEVWTIWHRRCTMPPTSRQNPSLLDRRPEQEMEHQQLCLHRRKFS